MSDTQIMSKGPVAARPDDEGFTHGYCDPEGNFLGFAPYMTLIPNLIPAKKHVKSGIVVPTGNQKILPKGRVITSDAGFGGQEQVLDGLEDDKGGGLAPTGAVPGTAIPEPKPELSPELQAKIAARNSGKKAKSEEPAKSEGDKE